MRLGMNGRRLVEREMSLDRYSERLSDFVQDALAAERSLPRTQRTQRAET